MSVGEVKVSHLSNEYFDIQLLIDIDEFTKIRIMGGDETAKLFADLSKEGSPIKLIGLNNVGSVVFYNTQRGSNFTKLSSPLDFEVVKICSGKVIATKVKKVLTCINERCQNILSDSTDIDGKSVTCSTCGFTTLKKYLMKYVVEMIIKDTYGKQHFVTCLPHVLNTVGLADDNVEKLLKFKKYDFLVLKSNKFVFRIEKYSPS